MKDQSAPRPVAILDTNVLLDWLVFKNPECAAVGSAVTAGDLVWVATDEMRLELGHVLAAGHLAEWTPDDAAVWDAWNSHCRTVAAPAPAGPPGRLRCSDRDDQKFIDLAIALAADWLLTRDRAILKLAGRLRAFGVRAATPDRWTPAPLSPGRSD